MLGEHGAARDAKRHVAADFKPDIAELLRSHIGFKEPVQSDDNSRAVRAPAGKPRFKRDMLFNMYVNAPADEPRIFEEGLRRAVGYVLAVRRQSWL